MGIAKTVNLSEAKMSHTGNSEGLQQTSWRITVMHHCTYMDRTSFFLTLLKVNLNIIQKKEVQARCE